MLRIGDGPRGPTPTPHKVVAYPSNMPSLYTLSGIPINITQIMKR